jgi:hypothetical protein
MQNVTREQVLGIVDTYTGMLRISWCPYLLAQRTKWLAELYRLEGRMPGAQVAK